MKVTINKVAQVVNRLMQVRPATTVGIDISSSAIKVAEVRWDNLKPVLKAVGMTELPANTVDDGYVADKALLAETLKRLLAVSGVEGTHVILSVSGQSVVVRELTFPDMSSEELRQAIKWELDKYIPAAEVENYYFDFAVVSTSCQEQEMKVLLVAVPLERITTLTDLMKELGLRPLVIEIEPLALGRTINDLQNAIVIDIGAKLCQLHIFQGGAPMVSRSIPVGGIRYTEAIMQALDIEFHEAERIKLRRNFIFNSPNALNENDVTFECMKVLIAELSREIRRMADYYQIQNPTSVIDSIVLTGGGSQLNNLSGNLAELLDGTKVVGHFPLTALQLAPSLDAEWLNGMAPQLAVAIGLALRGGEGE